MEGFGTLAQLVEQRTFNPLVGGSSPPRPTRIKNEIAQLVWAFLRLDFADRAEKPATLRPEREQQVRRAGDETSPAPTLVHLAPPDLPLNPAAACF